MKQKSWWKRNSMVLLFAIPLLVFIAYTSISADISDGRLDFKISLKQQNWQCIEKEERKFALLDEPKILIPSENLTIRKIYCYNEIIQRDVDI